MFQAIYIEDSIKNHPLTQSICKKFHQLPQISCDRYGEVFNRKAQNFRFQKNHPSLILAKKLHHYVLETPLGYGIGGIRNYYFSHMLNCIYDCKYCFLQGMYSSANYVLFVNFEDFIEAISSKILEEPEEKSYFFSGYDCDSLALESMTHFVEKFLPLFSKYPQAFLELRTKSTNIQSLLKSDPLPNYIVAFSLTPKEISQALENKTPSLEKRLEALHKLQEKGWLIGLRFDPLIYCDHFEEQYKQLFSEVFRKIKVKGLHSVTMGLLRFPRQVYKNIISLYPDEKLFAHSLEEKDSLVSYKENVEKKLMNFCKEEILRYIPDSLFFPCEVRR